jgi:phosphate transport system substrate-binding protein
MAAILTLLASQAVLDSDVPEYHPVPGLKGTLEFGPDEGYDALVGLWVQRMKSHYPDLRTPESRKISASVPQALQAATSRCGLMSRAWTERECHDFQDFWGSLPVEFVVGADAVSVIVHPDNPLAGLSLEDLVSIYSSDRHRAIRTWGDAGLGEGWKSRPLHVYAPKGTLRARQVFVDQVLHQSAFQGDVKELDDAAAVAKAVADDPLAIGFVACSSKVTQVRRVPLKSPEKVEYTCDDMLNQVHPLSWQIRLSYCRLRGESLDPALREFFLLILSRDGQAILADEGYVPISGPLARKQTGKLN